MILKDIKKELLRMKRKKVTALIGDLQADTGAYASTLTVPRLTTTERNALTAVNGMVIYNSPAHKFQGYEGGSWANLI